ncbi:hypothetical protein Godav_012986 [Gossypium davidsonii]|uniref:Uncharacterized protein n=1 Tax=Gossypium davidsonii TaxID=34287 RepID=A0A7J8RFN1_GOSDV|nr:hypothetical protein [Gossypium davidsonii]
MNLNDDWAGHIVGVILFNGVPQPESKTLMNMMYTSRPSPRWLEETKSSLNTTLAAQMLVRRTLAWITGVVLLIATLLGKFTLSILLTDLGVLMKLFFTLLSVAVYFLLNMPLTRDTLLYSNVKLD